MSAAVFCHGCGQQASVPTGWAKSKMRCPHCGVFVEVSQEIRDASAAAVPPPSRPPSPKKSQQIPTPRSIPQEEPAAVDDAAYRFADESPATKPPPPRPKRKRSTRPAGPDDDAVRVEAAPELLIEGTESDDGNPYQVTGDVPTKRCPDCDKKVELAATVCIHCGFDFRNKSKKDRVYEEIDVLYESGWPLQKRIGLFFGIQAVNLALIIFMVSMGSSLFGSATTTLISVGLQAFLVGTYQSLRMTRTEKGKVTLTKQWRYAFIPSSPETLRWKEFESLTVTRSNEFDFFGWVMAFILLGYCIVPGVLFYLFVLHPDKFTVHLCKDHSFPETPIFRTLDENRAREVMAAVSDSTTLPII